MGIEINYKGKPWLSAESTPNWTTNYEDEKWKIPCFYALTEKDREDVKRRGLVREYPTANYYGLEVKTDLKLPKS
jgi:hypothetical protein